MKPKKTATTSAADRVRELEATVAALKAEAATYGSTVEDPLAIELAHAWGPGGIYGRPKRHVAKGKLTSCFDSPYMTR